MCCVSGSHLEHTLELTDQVLHLSLHPGRQLCYSLALAAITTCLARGAASAASLTLLHATVQCGTALGLSLLLLRAAACRRLLRSNRGPASKARRQCRRAWRPVAAAGAPLCCQLLLPAMAACGPTKGVGGQRPSLAWRPSTAHRMLLVHLTHLIDPKAGVNGAISAPTK